MADSLIELGQWRGGQTSVGRILEALARLRHGEQRTATRTAVVNLVIVATDRDEAERACAAIQRLAGRHPGRTITLLLETGGDQSGVGGIDAEVFLNGTQAEGVPVWWEEVRLVVRGALVGHLDSVVEPLLVPDLPVALWFVGDLPAPDDPVLRTADAVLIDSREAPSLHTFTTARALARRMPLVDLSWIRLRPWRALLGGLFEGEAYRPFLPGIRSVRVAGKDGPRRLLAAWIHTQAGVAHRRFTLVPARHVALRVHAEHDGRVGVFEVERRSGERTVRSRAEIGGGPHHSDVAALPQASLPWSLAGALTHLYHDRVYEEVLESVVGFS